MKLHIRKLRGIVQTRYPAVFLHGFMGSGSDWESRGLSGLSGFAIDLPGHGKSVNLPSRCYDFNGVADLIRSSLVECEAFKIDLIGYSMGGRIALEFARRFPESVQHLVLESASPGLKTIGERKRRAEEDADRAVRLRTDPELFCKKWMDLEIFRSLKNKPLISKRLTRERLEGNAQEWARAIEGMSPSRQPDYRSWLSITRQRVTLITGELDLEYTAIARELCLSNRRMRHITVQDAGHNVHLEQPEMYLHTLQDILFD